LKIGEILEENMAHRSIILELTTDKEVVLSSHIEADWLVCQTFHDAMRDVVLQRGSKILYCSIINHDGPDTKG
jgi:hypothetical protein